MCEKIKWWTVFISVCIGILGGISFLDFVRNRNEIDKLNKQIEQKDMLINYLKEEVHNDR